MLLQKVVRPAKASGSGRDQDLRSVQRLDGRVDADVERLQESAQADQRNITTQCGGGVRGATKLGGNCQDSLVPELGGRSRLLLERGGRHAVDTVRHLQAVARRPRVQKLQREEWI